MFGPEIECRDSMNIPEVVIVDDEMIQPYTYDWSLRVDQRHKFVQQLHGAQGLNADAIPLEIDDLFKMEEENASDAGNNHTPTGTLKPVVSSKEGTTGQVAVCDLRAASECPDISEHASKHIADWKHDTAPVKLEAGVGWYVGEVLFFGEERWRLFGVLRFFGCFFWSLFCLAVVFGMKMQGDQALKRKADIENQYQCDEQIVSVQRERMASNPIAMESNLEAMASNLIAMESVPFLKNFSECLKIFIIRIHVAGTKVKHQRAPVRSSLSMENVLRLLFAVFGGKISTLTRPKNHMLVLAIVKQELRETSMSKTRSVRLHSSHGV